MDGGARRQEDSTDASGRLLHRELLAVELPPLPAVLPQAEASDAAAPNDPPADIRDSAAGDGDECAEEERPNRQGDDRNDGLAGARHIHDCPPNRGRFSSLRKWLIEREHNGSSSLQAPMPG